MGEATTREEGATTLEEEGTTTTSQAPAPTAMAGRKGQLGAASQALPGGIGTVGVEAREGTTTEDITTEDTTTEVTTTEDTATVAKATTLATTEARATIPGTTVATAGGASGTASVPGGRSAATTAAAVTSVHSLLTMDRYGANRGILKLCSVYLIKNA